MRPIVTDDDARATTPSRRPHLMIITRSGPDATLAEIAHRRLTSEGLVGTGGVEVDRGLGPVAGTRRILVCRDRRLIEVHDWWIIDLFYSF